MAHDSFFFDTSKDKVEFFQFIDTTAYSRIDIFNEAFETLINENEQPAKVVIQNFF